MKLKPPPRDSPGVQWMPSSRSLGGIAIAPASWTSGVDPGHPLAVLEQADLGAMQGCAGAKLFLREVGKAATADEVFAKPGRDRFRTRFSVGCGHARKLESATCCLANVCLHLLLGSSQLTRRKVELT